MFKWLIYFLAGSMSLACHSQTGLFINGEAASLRVDSTGFLSVNGDLRNLDCDPVAMVRFNGTLFLAGDLVNNDSIRFSATSGSGNAKKARVVFRNSPTYTTGISASISGSAFVKFWEVELDKAGGSVTLNTDVYCQDTLEFKNGQIFINGRKWFFVDPVGAPSVTNHPYIKNERNASKFMPVGMLDTGLVIYKTIFTSSLNINPANIGIKLTGIVDLGSGFNVYRGFRTQVNAGKSSIHKYFDIESPSYALTSNTVQVKYNYNDLYYFNSNYLSLPSLRLFVSENSDMNWTGLQSTQSLLVNTPGPVSDGEISADLSELLHPNINIAGTNIRVTVADPDCLNPPVSALSADTLHVCSGNTITIDAGNNSNIPNTSLRWEWNTSPPLYSQTFTVTPDNNFRTYKVSLTDVRGCVTLDSVVLAPAAPFPQITYFNHLNACLGDSIIIKDTVKIVSGTYNNSWTFSDGSTGTQLQQQFRKKFANSGQHAIQLTATSNYGCSVIATATNVIVYPLPTASFSHDFNCATGNMSYTSTSVSNYSALVISGYAWNLGQGPANTSSLAAPVQNYSSSGTYTVKHVAISSFGCKDSITMPVTIYPYNSAAFTKNNICHTGTVTLGNISACNTGSCSYQWDLGDGTTSANPSLTKVYTSPGFYNVKLKVTNPVGCPDSVSTGIFINPNPVAGFSASNTDICVNHFAYFTNTSSIASGSISGYLWDFNNTTTSTLTNGTGSYTNSGIFTVSLTAVSDSGCVDTFTYPLIVHPQPVAQFSVSDVCAGNASQFISGSSGAGLTYIWDFGNSVNTGTVNSGLQQYIYPAPGNYTSSLIAISNQGCSDTATVITTVLAKPAAGLGGAISTCGKSYTLDALNPGSYFLWLPGNQTSQKIVVNKNGLYQVSITGTNGCSATETVIVTLNDIVQPRLGNDTIVCGSLALSAGYPGAVYLWNNGALSQTILAITSGSYAVSVTDLNGCTGSDTISVSVLAPAMVDLGPDITTCETGAGYVITPTSNATTFQWSNGAGTATNQVVTSGTYWLEGTAANGCKNRDTVKIVLLAAPVVNLGPDRQACGSILLDAQNTGCTYSWNNTALSRTISADTTGHYKVIVTSTLTGCSGSDSVDLSIHPLVKVFLGNDTSVCSNTNFILNAGNAGATYTWTNGSNARQTNVSSSGIYGVTVKSPGGCTASDYIHVTVQSAPGINLGSSIRFLCGSNPVRLETEHTSGLSWGSSQGLSSSQRSLNVYVAGKYWASVTQLGCKASDTVLVVKTSNTIQAMFLASTQDTVNKPVQFVNLSVPEPVSQTWYFGDGLTSNDKHPVHTFVLPQSFSVTLEVSNGFCSDRITKEINVLFRKQGASMNGPVSHLTMTDFRIFPNPGSEEINVVMELNDFAPVEVRIFDLSGKMIRRKSEENVMYYRSTFDINDYANGIYFIHISAENLKGRINRSVKFIKN